MLVSPTMRRPHRIIARTLVFSTSALLAAGLLTWTPSPSTGWVFPAGEGTLWQLLNGARTNNGMAPLQQHGTLLGIARWRSQDMLDRNYFSHTIPGCNCLVYAYYDSNGVGYAWAGENIGWNSGVDDASSPVRVHEQFMASPGHRANVLTAAFTHGAVGAAGADNQMFLGYTQNTRMYTELFLQAYAAAPPPPPPPAPAPAPPPPSSGGGGGGYAQPVPQPVAEVPPPPEPTPKEMAVDTPRRPTSSAGLDGVTRLVVQPRGVQLAARLAADDALGIGDGARADGTDEPKQPQLARRALEVTAAAPAQAGLFEGIVGSLLGFLFG
jgi:uncharacterized protein YkwD